MSILPPYNCDECEEEFDNLDSYVEHLVQSHDIPQDKICLQYSTEQQPDIQGSTPQRSVPAEPNNPHSNQQMENGIRPLLENPEEAERLIDTVFERWGVMKKEGLQHQWRMILVVGGLFTIVLIASSILTYVGTLQGSAYTLLLGTLIGYLLTFLEDYIWRFRP